MTISLYNRVLNENRRQFTNSDSKKVENFPEITILDNYIKKISTEAADD